METARCSTLSDGVGPRFEMENCPKAQLTDSAGVRYGVLLPRLRPRIRLCENGPDVSSLSREKRVWAYQVGSS